MFDIISFTISSECVVLNVYQQVERNYLIVEEFKNKYSIYNCKKI